MAHARQTIREAAATGFSGAIVPDLTPEAAARELDGTAGLDLIPMVAPTTPAARLRRLVLDADDSESKNPSLSKQARGK